MNMNNSCKFFTPLLVSLFTGFVQVAYGHSSVIGERPVIERHVDQMNIDNGKLNVDELFQLGNDLFTARFNRLDGQGRPTSTGTGAFRNEGQPDFIRTSAPESNSCFGCHNIPEVGGAGEFVVNVFVLAQAADPVIESVSADFSNDRNTLGMFGAGPIEMLSREMSEDLIAIREQTAVAALSSGNPETRALISKGVSFGAITVMPNGKVDPSDIEGVDWDLIIKPFHQKGAVVSLRQFTNNAMNHHHGMQSVERFGENTDPDSDQVMNELSVGDITALSIYQAALSTPTVVMPRNHKRRKAVKMGRRMFDEIECSSCHVPLMRLNSRYFTEPSPFNPPGNTRPDDVGSVFAFDMTREGDGIRLSRSGKSGARIRAFTDMKRHNLCDAGDDFYCNEQLTQGSLVGFANVSDFTIAAQPRPTEEFLSRKLWDVGNSDPYGHRGDLTTLTEAIDHHAGEARNSRDAFFALPQSKQNAIIEFLKSLQVVD